MIDDLPLLTPDPQRAARTRARCHQALEARRQRFEGRDRQASPNTAMANYVVLAGMCVAYLMSMAANLVRLIGPR